MNFELFYTIVITLTCGFLLYWGLIFSMPIIIGYAFGVLVLRLAEYFIRAWSRLR